MRLFPSCLVVYFSLSSSLAIHESKLSTLAIMAEIDETMAKLKLFSLLKAAGFGKIGVASISKDGEVKVSEVGGDTNSSSTPCICGKCHKPGPAGPVHPMEPLKEAKVAPSKLDIISRCALVGKAILLAQQQKVALTPKFFPNEEVYDYVLKDLLKWEEALRELVLCPDDVASVEAVFRKHWDSPIGDKVRDARGLRPCSYVRKAFLAATQRRLADIMIPLARLDRRVDAVVAPPKEEPAPVQQQSQEAAVPEEETDPDLPDLEEPDEDVSDLEEPEPDVPGQVEETEPSTEVTDQGVVIEDVPA